MMNHITEPISLKNPSLPIETVQRKLQKSDFTPANWAVRMRSKAADLAQTVDDYNTAKSTQSLDPTQELWVENNDKVIKTTPRTPKKIPKSVCINFDHRENDLIFPMSEINTS